MAVIIDLIRHGESEWVKRAEAMPVKVFGGRMNEVPLSETGRGQAFHLGLYAVRNGIRPTHFVSSVATRALETHDFSAQGMHRRVQVAPEAGLVEMDWGDWTRMPRTVAETKAVKRARAKLGFGFAPPRGESFDMVRARALPVILGHAKRAGSGHVWVHTHRNVIKAVVRQWFSGWTPDNISDVPLDVVSLTRLRYSGGKLELVFFNQPTLPTGG